jgi:hypothetical protein
MSVSIRRTGDSRKFRSSRAMAYIEKDSQGNDVLQDFKQFVRFMLRKSSPSIPDRLVNRLTEAVGMRRQQFYYQRAHKGKMSTSSNVAPTLDERHSQVNPPTIVETSKSRASEIKSRVETAPAPPKSTYSMKTFETAATQLTANPEQELPDPKLESRATKTEIAGRNIFPGPPNKPLGKDFECYQCFYILPAATREDVLWR